MTNLSPRPVVGAGLVVGLLALALCPAAARADHLVGRLGDVVSLPEGATILVAPVDRMTYQPEPAHPQAPEDAGDVSAAVPSTLALIGLVPPGTAPVDPVTAASDPSNPPPPSPPAPPPPPPPPPPAPPPPPTTPSNPPSTPPGPPPNGPPGGPVTTASTPEPTSLLLGVMGMGMAGMASWVRRRKNGQAEKKG